MVEPKENAATLARTLIAQAQTEPLPVLDTERIIELLETVVVYKFPQLNREEIAAMLGISELRQTKVFQEFYEEGQQRGRQQEGVTFVLRLLTRQLGDVSAELQAQITELSVVQLEELGEALLDFEGLADLENWFSQLRQLREQVLQQLIQQLNQEADEWDSAVVAHVKVLSLTLLAELADAVQEFTVMPELVDWLQRRATENYELGSG